MTNRSFVRSYYGKKVLNLAAVMVLGMLTVVISGCATDRVDLVDAGVLSLEQDTMGKVYIAWGEIYEDGDGFVVTGVLKRRDPAGQPINAHVDVTNTVSRRKSAGRGSFIRYLYTKTYLS